MKNKSSWIIVILLLLVGVTSVYVASTYAKYTETLQPKTGEATIAKWAFASDNESKTITVDFSTTYDPATLVAQRIAPGTQGGFKIEVANTNGETGVDFTMNFGNVTPAIGTFTFSVIPDITETATGTTAIENPSAGVFTGHINPGETRKLLVSWAWAYEATGDAAAIAAQDEDDTDIGIAGGASGTKLQVPVTIIGVQSRPAANGG